MAKNTAINRLESEVNQKLCTFLNAQRIEEHRFIKYK